MVWKREENVRELGAVIFTPSTRTTGVLRTIHWRLSDTLNALDQEFILIHDAVVQPLHATAGDELSTSWSLLRKDSIVLAQIDEAVAGQEIPPARQALVSERTPLRGKLEAWPFIVDATLHLPPNVDLLQHIHDPHRQFMPLTDAQVTYQPSLLLSFKAPFLLVNRQKVEVVLDAATLGMRAAHDPEVGATLKAVDTEVSGARASELLASTTIFKVVDLPQLTSVCADLCRSRRISRKLIEAGVEVFGQGDKGDSMYVVESGGLDAFLKDAKTGQETALATFKPGDIFGEMAILGEGHRTATVRAKDSSSLIAIHEDAVQTLVQRFPTASTRLLTLILARRGGLDAVQRSFSLH